MSRVSRIANHAPTIRFGVSGNVYVFCKIKSPLIRVCRDIGKAQSAIYWNDKHECFCFKVKGARQRKALAEL